MNTVGILKLSDPLPISQPSSLVDKRSVNYFQHGRQERLLFAFILTPSSSHVSAQGWNI